MKFTDIDFSKRFIIAAIAIYIYIYVYIIVANCNWLTLSGMICDSWLTIFLGCSEGIFRPILLLFTEDIQIGNKKCCANWEIRWFFSLLLFCIRRLGRSVK